MAGIINSPLGASLLLVVSCLRVFVFRFHHCAAKIFRAPAFGEVKIEVDGCLAQESPTLPGFSGGMTETSKLGRNTVLVLTEADRMSRFMCRITSQGPEVKTHQVGVKQMYGQ